MKRLLPIALSVALLVPIATALGAMPKPKDPQINPPTELAGIELGMKMEKAKKQWGKNRGKCHTQNDRFEICSYGNVRKRGVAEIHASNGKVFVVIIQLPAKKSGKAEVKGPLLELISMEGIGLGSKMKDVKEAYPDADRLPKKLGYELEGPGESAMVFTGNGTKHNRKVTVISMFTGIPD